MTDIGLPRCLHAFFRIMAVNLHPHVDSLLKFTEFDNSPLRFIKVYTNTNKMMRGKPIDCSSTEIGGNSEIKSKGVKTDAKESSLAGG
jgi:hypothetical protein